MQILKRKNVGTSYTEFDFAVNPYAVLVKNFTTSDIFVSLGETPQTDADAIKIPVNSSQVCLISLREDFPISFDKVYVKASTAGDVEVQVVSW